MYVKLRQKWEKGRAGLRQDLREGKNYEVAVIWGDHSVGRKVDRDVPVTGQLWVQFGGHQGGVDRGRGRDVGGGGIGVEVKRIEDM